MATPTTDVASFDGVRIATTVAGDGPDVLLVHGFASSARANWGTSGVVDALVAAGRRVTTLDVRGHGRSDKPHDPASYAGGAMVRDAGAVLDHLGIEAVDLVGYSMGAMIAGRAAATDPRVRSLVLGGVGGELRPKHDGSLAPALLADDPESIRHPTARAFRTFADLTGADRHALAALDGSGTWSDPVDFDAITVPTLVLVGARDTLIGSPERLAGHIAGARLQVIGGDHLGAVGDAGFVPAIVDFLAEVSPARTT